MAKTVSVAVIALTNLGCHQATMRFRLSTVANLTNFYGKTNQIFAEEWGGGMGEVLKTKFAGAVINCWIYVKFYKSIHCIAVS